MQVPPWLPSLPLAGHFHFPYKYLLPCHLFFHATSPQAPPLLCLRGKEASSQSEAQSRALLQQLQTITRQTAGSDRAYVMSRGSKGGRGGGLDLKLRLSPPAPPARGTAGAGAGAASLSSDEEWSLSSPSSCLSSEGEREPQRSHGLQWSDSPEATSMVLAACPRCLMYVMLSEADPRCPRCRSPVLLDFLHHAARNRNNSSINVSREDDDDDHSRNSTRGGGGGGGGRNRRA